MKFGSIVDEENISGDNDKIIITGVPNSDDGKKVKVQQRSISKESDLLATIMLRHDHGRPNGAYYPFTHNKNNCSHVPRDIKRQANAKSDDNGRVE